MHFRQLGRRTRVIPWAAGNNAALLLYSLFLLFLRQTGLKQQRLCATPPIPPQNPNIRNLSLFRPHSRALQFQDFITAVECYRNSLESDRTPFTAPSTVLHRDRASRSNGTNLFFRGAVRIKTRFSFQLWMRLRYTATTTTTMRGRASCNHRDGDAGRRLQTELTD